MKSKWIGKGWATWAAAVALAFAPAQKASADQKGKKAKAVSIYQELNSSGEVVHQTTLRGVADVDQQFCGMPCSTFGVGDSYVASCKSGGGHIFGTAASPGSASNAVILRPGCAVRILIYAPASKSKQEINIGKGSTV